MLKLLKARVSEDKHMSTCKYPGRRYDHVHTWHGRVTPSVATNLPRSESLHLVSQWRHSFTLCSIQILDPKNSGYSLA